jgi:hypothetical protein
MNDVSLPEHKVRRNCDRRRAQAELRDMWLEM